MKVGTSGGSGWLTGVVDAVTAAEEMGYDEISNGELQHDSMLSAALAAANSSRIGIGTFTIAFPRSPMVLAMEAWDIQHLSKGRFTIGLGTQVKGHNINRFSTEWPGAPAPRIKEYITMMRAVWKSFQTGEKPDYAGKYYHYTLMTPAFNPGPIDYPAPKIGLGCVGDGMSRVAGEVADVVMPHGFMTDKYMRDVLLPNVAIGLKRGGRTWSDIEVTGGGFTVFGETDSEIEQKLDGLRRPISFYGSTRSYHEIFEVHGLKDFGMQLHSMSLQGKWDDMRSAVTEDIVRVFAQTSTYDKLPEFVQEHREYASRISLGDLPTQTPEQRERAKHIIAEVQKVKVPGVPKGLEI
ncbi:MAG: TIGR03617 family F420-dependent LLM class oxidoreductase [Dehalococcoidia bacterium]|nr:TIGR03617 family F420-dependent LLM class oxidoreductase [Dehalococcoidia bacterium]MCB9485247.1 TIGR03617 family F420-dependent LLM class oxidoreductase [Thermoflexaceae bacterium]